MSTLTTLLFWAPIAFVFVATASYAGAMAALKRYHDDESFSATDVIRIEENDDGSDGR
ncbi:MULTISPECIES: hypothetical protein [Halolamina]|uniref:Uncharacterized protein n=1 Tax=Halolamina pelagica TaxID=699431 RepID=A0A1I5PLQ2_9EURY|nr:MULTISPECIES: hypothetical protein [Halolamina]NHX34874.1 hypothetical protein [Halolamina sp. R1-12]SFP34984.1 hypothetical protein SAMN05216277_10329 [Halolamina pelagica]